MGYTHYWKRKKTIPAAQFQAIVADFNKLIPAFQSDGPQLANGNGSADSEPTITDQEVTFNGVGDNHHETFAFPRVDPEGGDFCKTVRKPYDLAVTAFLIIAKHHLGSEITVNTDGEHSDWLAALNLVETHLHYGVPYSIVYREGQGRELVKS